LDLEIERGGVLTFAESEGSIVMNAIQLLWQNGKLAFSYKHNIYSVFIAIKSLSREKIIIIQLLDSTKEQHWTILLSIPKRKRKKDNVTTELVRINEVILSIQLLGQLFFCCCSWLNTLVRARHTRFAWGYYYCCWMWREQEPVEILLFCIHKYASTLYWKIIDDPYTWTIELVHGIPANLKSL
jgi:hypothetical protein